VTVVGGQPANIPPVGGQTSAGTTDLSVGVLQGTVDGNCVCPRCGTTVPHLRGTACYTIPCPKCNTLMVREGAVINPLRVVPQNIYSTAQSSAGTVVGGQPANIPPIGGQTSAGTVTAGQPGTIPPMGQTSAGVTVAGIPNISTGIAAAGQPVTITPMGQTSAGVLSSALTIAGTDSGHICIAATGSTIDAPVADLFDRAPYFLIVGLGSFRAIPNPNVHDLTGVGVQSAQLVVSEGAKAVITNDIGIKALEQAAGSCLYRSDRISQAGIGMVPEQPSITHIAKCHRSRARRTRSSQLKQGQGQGRIFVKNTIALIPDAG